MYVDGYDRIYEYRDVCGAHHLNLLQSLTQKVLLPCYSGNWAGQAIEYIP